MVEEFLEELPGIKAEDNQLVSIVTRDPNPVHNESYMRHIEYEGKTYSKKPLIMGTVIETLAVDSISRRFAKGLNLHNLVTDFKGVLYPSEPISVYRIDSDAQLVSRFADDEIYTVALRKKGSDFAVVNLGLSSKCIDLPETQMTDNTLSNCLNPKDIAEFARVTNSNYLQDFLLASRSSIVALNINNSVYPQLACLNRVDLFPIYKRHQAVFSRHMANLGLSAKINMNLTVKIEDKKRPDIYTRVDAFVDPHKPLFTSESHIATIPRTVALGKFIENL